jgi:hypothetical protein
VYEFRELRALRLITLQRDVIIISVDWRNGARMYYPQVVANTRVVAAEISRRYVFILLPRLCMVAICEESFFLNNTCFTFIFVYCLVDLSNCFKTQAWKRVPSLSLVTVLDRI